MVTRVHSPLYYCDQRVRRRMVTVFHKHIVVESSTFSSKKPAQKCRTRTTPPGTLNWDASRLAGSQPAISRGVHNTFQPYTVYPHFFEERPPPHRAALSQPRVDVQSVVVFHDDGAFAPSPWQYVVLKIPFLTGVDRGVPLSPDSLSPCARMGDRLSHLICLLCPARSPGSSRSDGPDEFLLWQSFCCQ